MKDVGLSTLIQPFELDVLQELAILVKKPRAAVDLRLVHECGQETHRRVHGQHVIERPAVEIPLIEFPPILAIA